MTNVPRMKHEIDLEDDGSAAAPSRWTCDETRSKKDENLRMSFGISLDDYEDMLKEQKHCCAICGVHESFFDRALAVDHCHGTGVIRGLLCGRCNQGIAPFEGNPGTLLAAHSYLTRDFARSQYSVTHFVDRQRMQRLFEQRLKSREKAKQSAG